MFCDSRQHALWLQDGILPVPKTPIPRPQIRWFRDGRFMVDSLVIGQQIPGVKTADQS